MIRPIPFCPSLEQGRSLPAAVRSMLRVGGPARGITSLWPTALKTQLVVADGGLWVR
jgi:hypothetical protein